VCGCFALFAVATTAVAHNKLKIKSNKTQIKAELKPKHQRPEPCLLANWK